MVHIFVVINPIFGYLNIGFWFFIVCFLPLSVVCVFVYKYMYVCMYVPTYVGMLKLYLCISSDFVIGHRLFGQAINKRELYYYCYDNYYYYI
jgi:hypothetical protein